MANQREIIKAKLGLPPEMQEALDSAADARRKISTIVPLGKAPTAEQQKGKDAAERLGYLLEIGKTAAGLKLHPNNKLLATLTGESGLSQLSSVLEKLRTIAGIRNRQLVQILLQVDRGADLNKLKEWNGNGVVEKLKTLVAEGLVQAGSNELFFLSAKGQEIISLV